MVFRIFQTLKIDQFQSNDLQNGPRILSLVKTLEFYDFDHNFRWRRWGSSLPGLCTLDPLLSPPSKPAEIFQRMCLRGGVKFV